MEKLEKINNLKNAVVIKWFLLLVIVMFYFLYLSWEKELYYQNKALLAQEVEKYNILKKHWLNYQDYKSKLESWSDQDLLLQKVWEKFYSQNFKNDLDKDYIDFLNSKQKEIAEKKLNPDIIAREEKLQKVLPSYTKWVLISWNMSDFEFVNYVENLLKTFNLSTTSNIWIKEIEPLNKDENNKGLKKQQDNLSSQLFYIPLWLEINWKKSDILDFLYYIEKTWVISWVNDTKIEFYNDDYLSNVSFIWNTWNKNIYENKIIDISKISFSKYIDTSYNIRGSSYSNIQWFINFIKNSEEKNQAYKVDLTLNFYVRWLPLYILDNYNKNVISNYKKLEISNTELLNLIKQNNKLILNNNKSDIISKTKSIEKFFTENNSNLKQLEAWLKDKTKLDIYYQKSYKLNNDLIMIDKIINDLKQQIKTINK